MTMDYLQIKRRTFRKLSSFCSPDLLSCVFDNFGQEKVKIDESNNCDDIWVIDDFVNDTALFLEKMKVLRVFDYLLGEIIYQSEPTVYSVLCSKLKRIECRKVLLFWLHTEMNGIIPFFEIGDMEVPEITPIYRCLKLRDTLFVIEKKQRNGEYAPTNEYFPTEEACQTKVDELNDDILES